LYKSFNVINNGAGQSTDHTRFPVSCRRPIKTQDQKMAVIKLF